MSQNQKTRSALTINAVAAGAAALAPKVATTGAAVLNPLNKLEAIAGLAGLVLRLFRSKEPAAAAGTRATRIQEGSKREARRTAGAGAPSARGRPAALEKGGIHHG